MEQLIIIGSGPAGYTAAIYSARAGLAPILFTGSLPGGLLTQTTEIENFPGFPDGIQGFDLMENMRKQAKKFGTRLHQATISKVEFSQEGGLHRVMTDKETFEAKAVIIATGSSPRWLGLDSETRLKNKGVSACATCDGFFYQNVPVVVIGGGDSAMEEAVFLTRFASEVFVIHRRGELRASKIMAERALNNPKIKFVWHSTVEEVLGENEVNGVRVKNIQTGEVSEIPCKAYFAALGHVPSTSAFQTQIEMDAAGFILVKHPTTQTHLAGVFAAGDCSDNQYRQAITAAGTGCRAAMDAERWLEAHA